PLDVPPQPTNARCGPGAAYIFRPLAEIQLPSQEAPPPTTPPPNCPATCRCLQDGPFSSSPSPVSLPWSIPGNPANLDLRNEPRHQVESSGLKSELLRA